MELITVDGTAYSQYRMTQGFVLGKFAITDFWGIATVRKVAVCRRLLGMAVAESAASPQTQSLRGQAPNLRRSLTPHDPYDRLRIRGE